MIYVSWLKDFRSYLKNKQLPVQKLILPVVGMWLLTGALFVTSVPIMLKNGLTC